MPSLGADMESGTLVEWRIKPGDTVHRGDIVAVVDTDKAAIEIEVFESGVVERLVAEPGDRVAVGAPLAFIRGTDEAPHMPPSTAAVPPAEQRVSPAARKLARERGVDLRGLPGSGPGGAITVADVERATPAAQADERHAMRAVIAGAMSRSKREIPHYYLATSIDLDAALAWMQAQNESRPVTERLLPAALLLKAVGHACRDVPEMNGHFHAGAFAPSAEVRLGFAIALRGGGLVAPVIPDPERRSLDDVMRGLRDLVDRAREGKLRASEIAGQTITVTSLGDRGADTVFGVIHPPQVALVGFGRIAERALVLEGKVVARSTVQISLSADHRVSDGHRGAVFLDAIDRRLQQPESLR